MTIRVPLWGKPSGYATIDPKATRGAVIGENVWNEDGSLFVPGTVATPAGTYPVTIWRRVMEVPANVKALASQSGTGLYAITAAGVSATRTIEPTAGETTVSNGSGIAGNPKVGLADLPDNGGAALLKITRDGKGRVSGTSAATTDDLAEGAGNLYHTAARVRAVLLTGLSTATNAVITAADSVLSALGKLQAQITAHVGRADNPHSVTAAQAGAVASIVAGTNVSVDATDPQNPIVSSTGGTASMPPGYIDGLRMVWVSGTALTVTSGAAYIQAAGTVLEAPSDIAKSSLSLTASTWYHVYLFDNAGTADVEIVTTAPADPYNGTARSKNGDTSRRYLGSVKSDSSGSMLQFKHDEGRGEIFYFSRSSSIPQRILSNGSATTSTDVSASGAIPMTSTTFYARLVNLAVSDGAIIAYLSNPDATPTITTTEYIISISKNVDTYAYVSTSSDQRVNYVFSSTPSSGGFYVDITGYVFGR